MEEKKLTEQESLHIIQQMIQTAKQEQKDNGLGWIIWGWTLFAVSRYFFFKKPKKVRTYTGDLFDKLNAGFFIFLILIILSINVGVPPSKGFMLLIGLYGFWILIYGTALNFKPSVIAAYITWAIAFAGLFIDRFIHPAGPGDLPDAANVIGLERFQWVMLFHAFAVLCGYIIPGHMANKEFNRLKRKVNIQSV